MEGYCHICMGRSWLSIKGGVLERLRTKAVALSAWVKRSAPFRNDHEEVVTKIFERGRFLKRSTRMEASAPLLHEPEAQL
jgi:hypothetical protein